MIRFCCYTEQKITCKKTFGKRAILLWKFVWHYYNSHGHPVVSLLHLRGNCHLIAGRTELNHNLLVTSKIFYMTYNYLLQLVSFLLQSKYEFLFAIHNNHLQKSIFQADLIFNCPVLQFHGGFIHNGSIIGRLDAIVNAFRNYFW